MSCLACYFDHGPSRRSSVMSPNGIQTFVYTQPQPRSPSTAHVRHLQDGATLALLGFARRLRTRAEDGTARVVSTVRWDRERVTYRIASSKTLLRFRCVSAEHSRYFWALISFATMTACSYCMGAIFFCLRLSLVASSSLKSSLVPTRMMGTPGAWWSISGYHCRWVSGGWLKDGMVGAPLPLRYRTRAG